MNLKAALTTTQAALHGADHSEKLAVGEQTL
jgi:hypothetical protein